MPKAPANPAKAPQPRSTRAGSDSPVSSAIRSIDSRPQAWATATTRNTLARRAARPPEKSPPPHDVAASRLKPEASRVPGVTLPTIHVVEAARRSSLQNHHLGLIYFLAVADKYRHF